MARATSKPSHLIIHPQSNMSFGEKIQFPPQPPLFGSGSSEQKLSGRFFCLSNSWDEDFGSEWGVWRWFLGVRVNVCK